MKHGRVAFVLAILANLAWISWSTFQPIGSDASRAALLLVGPSFVSIVIYQLYLSSRGQFLTQRDIDSIYYLGFLITLMVLAAAAFQVAGYDTYDDSEVAREAIPAIGLKFALGLLATGYGLFARITLQSKLIAPDDATNAIEGYIDGIGRMNDRINTTTQEIDRLVGEILKNASEASKRVGQAVISTLSTELEPTAKRLSDAIRQLNEMVASLGTGPLKNLGELTQRVSTGFEALDERLPATTRGLGSLASSAAQAASAQNDLTQAAVAAAASIKASEIAIEAVGNVAGPAREQLQVLTEAVRSANASLSNTPKAAASLELGLQAAADAMQALKDRAVGLTEATAAYQKALDAKPLRDFDQSLTATVSSADRLTKEMNGVGRSIRSVGEKFSNEIGTSAERIVELAQSMTSTSEQLGLAMERLAIAIRDAAAQVAR